ncbi:hypothetical protein CISIN_1g0380631mg, partial [Citrus sinensis]
GAKPILRTQRARN